MNLDLFVAFVLGVVASRAVMHLRRPRRPAKADAADAERVAAIRTALQGRDAQPVARVLATAAIIDRAEQLTRLRSKGDA